MNHLTFINQYKKTVSFGKNHYLTLMNRVCSTLKLSKRFDIELVMVDNPTIQKYNQQFRQKNKPTDVLSFPMEEEKEVTTKNVLLGVIMISFEKALEQATEYGHTLKRELSFLFVHGMLHLLGYDHQDKVNEEKMIALQDAIIGKRVTL